jgi:hypothetical protein
MASSMLPLDKIVADIVAMGFSHGQVGCDGMGWDGISCCRRRGWD